MRSKNFDCNKQLQYIIEKTGFKHQEIADLIGCERTSVINWVNNRYKMKKESFDNLLLYLPEYLEEQIALREEKINQLKHFYKQVVSLIHNELHPSAFT